MTKLLNGIDITRTSKQVMLQITGDSLVHNKDEDAQYQTPSAYFPIPMVNAQGQPLFDGAGIVVRTVGRPAMTVRDMMNHINGAPTGDDCSLVDPFWNPLAKANIQVLEGCTNDQVADPSLTPVQVCRRLDLYTRMKASMGLQVVLVLMISGVGRDTVADYVDDYFMAGSVGNEYWRQTGAKRCVSFAGTEFAPGEYTDTAIYKADQTHLTELGRQAYMSYQTPHIHSLIYELDATALFYPLNLAAYQ